jgi:hypothetical protein
MRRFEARLLVGKKDFFLLRNVQIFSGLYQGVYSMVTGDIFPKVKADGK